MKSSTTHLPLLLSSQHGSLSSKRAKVIWTRRPVPLSLTRALATGCTCRTCDGHSFSQLAYASEWEVETSGVGGVGHANQRGAPTLCPPVMYIGMYYIFIFSHPLTSVHRNGSLILADTHSCLSARCRRNLFFYPFKLRQDTEKFHTREYENMTFDRPRGYFRNAGFADKMRIQAL